MARWPSSACRASHGAPGLNGSAASISLGVKTCAPSMVTAPAVSRGPSLTGITTRARVRSSEKWTSGGADRGLGIAERAEIGEDDADVVIEQVLAEEAAPEERRAAGLDLLGEPVAGNREVAGERERLDGDARALVDRRSE